MALADALVRVRCGPAERPPTAPPLQALLNGLLELVPERRSTVAELCEAPYFELMRGGPDEDSLLSLTFDQARPGEAKPAKRRPRSAGRTLRKSLAAPAVARAPAPADAGQFPPREVTPPLAEGVPPEDWARASFAVAP